jgi:carboxylesterase type B
MYLCKYTYVHFDQNPGAFHGSELFLLFGVLWVTDPASARVSENMIDLWTRFAKTATRTVE